MCSRFVRLAAASTLACLLASGAHATSFKVLHHFNGTDGSDPNGGFAFDAAGNAYGTTQFGGAHGGGTLFKLSPRGFTTVHDFSAAAQPMSSLSADARGRVFGTTSAGGSHGAGTVFEYDAASGLRVLHEFDDLVDGGHPMGGVVPDADGSLYGTTSRGGDVVHCVFYGCGTVFKIGPRMRALATLHAFDVADGDGSRATPTLSDGRLWGTTTAGGAYDVGAPFSMNLDGTLFADVATNAYNEEFSFFQSGLARDAAGNLWGVVVGGGNANQGGIYRIDPAGNYSVAFLFSGYDGANPIGTPAIGPDGAIYGTTASDYALGCGTVYRFDPATQLLKTLHTFRNSDGCAPPNGALAIDGAGALYGATTYGGQYNGGTVFRIEP
jgi:uncharacterized repeat protein (TIGR03803 family)